MSRKYEWGEVTDPETSMVRFQQHCAVCGAPKGTPCTKECDDDSVPDDLVKAHALAAEIDFDLFRGKADFEPRPPSLQDQAADWAAKLLKRVNEIKADTRICLRLPLFPGPVPPGNMRVVDAQGRVLGEVVNLKLDGCECGSKEARGNAAHYRWCPWSKP